MFILLFADDAVLFAHTQEALQSLLNDLQYYCTTWKLKVNTNTTKIMIFKNGWHTRHDFLLTNTVLEVLKRSNTLVYALHRNRYSPYTTYSLFLIRLNKLYNLN